MKLSTIVSYKNKLEGSTPLDTAPLVHSKLAPVLHSVESSEVQLLSLTEQLGKNYSNILAHLSEFEDTVESIKDEVQRLIEQLEPVYYNESWQRYIEEITFDSNEYILNRRFAYDQSVIDFITARVQSHSNWLYPGMILRPGREDWISYLVGCDPLYLVDVNTDLLEPAVLRFNDQYQRRLRTYAITESIDTPILDRLPDNQFSYCLAWNFFNYKPIEIIKAYLNEIYQKLKPGGCVSFTFNDCDRSGAVELAERKFSFYTPWRVIREHTESLGLEAREIFRIDDSCTWVELYKPGSLSSMRGGQTLAKLIYKDNESMYTDEERARIRQQAIELQIYNPFGNTPEVVNQIPTAQLVQLIKQRTNK